MRARRRSRRHPRPRPPRRPRAPRASSCRRSAPRPRRPSPGRTSTGRRSWRRPGAGAARPPPGHALRHPVLRDGLGAGLCVLHAARSFPDAHEHDVRRRAARTSRRTPPLYYADFGEPRAHPRERPGPARRRDLRRSAPRPSPARSTSQSLDLTRVARRWRPRSVAGRRNGPRERGWQSGTFGDGCKRLRPAVVPDDGRLPGALGHQAGQPLLHGCPRHRDSSLKIFGLRRRGTHPAGLLRGRAGDPRDGPRVQPDVAWRSGTHFREYLVERPVDALPRRRREPRAPALRRTVRAAGTGCTPTRRGRTCRSTASAGSSAARSTYTRKVGALRLTLGRARERYESTHTRDDDGRGARLHEPRRQERDQHFLKLGWTSGPGTSTATRRPEDARFRYEGDVATRLGRLDVLQPEGRACASTCRRRLSSTPRSAPRSASRRGATSCTARTTRPCSHDLRPSSRRTVTVRARDGVEERRAGAEGRISTTWSSATRSR